MPQKTAEKNNAAPGIKTSIMPISIINNPGLKPYIESFSYAPENITQQPLGDLLGFFRIRDTSDDSAYIVNFLASVVKKEYYINPKRLVENSFDLALHKANVALSELAKNGNINWLGAVDAAIGVTEGNTFHFSVAGEAKILLFRDGILTDISEGLASFEEEPHPLKTFVNVSSGIIRPGDKIIITSNDIFRVFSLAEIKKNAERFPGEKFVQFLHTALVNELEAAEAIVIDVSEAEKLKKKKIKEQKEELYNVFSEKAFKGVIYSRKKTKPALSAAKDKKIIDYVDEKTGHIYIQEEEGLSRRRSVYSLYWFLLKEKLADVFYRLKDKIRQRVFLIGQKFKSLPKINKVQSLIGPGLSLGRRLKNVKNKVWLPSLKTKLSGVGREGVWKEVLRFLPSFSKAKKAFAGLTREQRLYGLLILAAVIVLPFLFIKIKNREPAAPSSSETIQVKSQREILSADKNINLDAGAAIIDSSAQAMDVLLFGDSIFAITKNSIIARSGDENKNEFPLTAGEGNIAAAAVMKDLKLFFLLTDQKKIISWSPVTREFKANEIAIPDTAAISSLGTYLTYLYLVDSRGKQIYRYPRSESGFGEKVNWLKNSSDAGKVSDIAIDENIYLAQGSALTKLFRGKKQDFNIEPSATPINFDKIFTTSETDKLYALDAANSRLIILGKNGEIQSQYYNELLKNAQDFSVNMENNKVYFVTSEGKVATMQL